jgi:DNA ligase-associated metallophosphoesterase
MRHTRRDRNRRWATGKGTYAMGQKHWTIGNGHWELGTGASCPLPRASVCIQWAAEEIVLLSDRAVYWPRMCTLILADAHFGKSAAYRNLGVPVPEATTQHDVDRLSRLVTSTSAKRMIIVGDFLHARGGRSEETMNALAAWRQRHCKLKVILVRGNHDRLAGDPPPEWNVECVDEPFCDNLLTFCHEPCALKSHHVICGHIHPSATLHDVDGSSMRMPCFWFSRRLAVLPAFGSFTGTRRIGPKRGDRVFAIGNGVVAEAVAIRAAKWR